MLNIFLRSFVLGHMTHALSKLATLRRLCLGVFACAIVVAMSAISTLGWSGAWRLVAVPGKYPPFADMRTVQAAIAAEQQGLDPLVTNPSDPWARPLNYPRVWVSVARVFSLQYESRYLAFVGVFVAAFLASIAALLWRYPSFWLLAGALSHSTLLAIERGNNDLIIFLLMAATAATELPLIALLLIVGATLLKIYPAVAIVRLAHFPRWLIPGLLLVLGCVVWQAGDIAKIAAATPASGYLSFGSKSIALMSAGMLRWWWILTALMVVAFVIGRCAAHRLQPLTEHTNSLSGRLFLMGASIFVAVFAIGSNWDYRLIFLLLCVPHIVDRCPIALRVPLLVTLLVAMNEYVLVYVAPLLKWICTGAKCALFIVLSIALFDFALARWRALW